MFSLISFTGNKKMELTSIAEAFSNGEFQIVIPYLDKSIIWTVVGENQYIGKQAVIDNCLLVENYFNSVTTNFETLNIIADNNKIVINGTAEFMRNNNQISLVSACDIYEFNSENKIVGITSYCIQHK